MTLDELIEKVQSRPKKVEFADVISVIDANYDFVETAFTNGEVKNDVGQNSGSCKILSFAKLNKLTEDQTLALFGIYYRADVLSSPEGDDHQNIRQFMKHGWAGVEFTGDALKSK